jgi:hypothetical protein
MAFGFATLPEQKPLAARRGLLATLASCAKRACIHNWTSREPVFAARERGHVRIHPKFGFKKHGNGIHPPICFLLKCVSKVRPANTMASLLSVSGGKSPEIIAFPGSEPF